MHLAIGRILRLISYLMNSDPWITLHVPRGSRDLGLWEGIQYKSRADSKFASSQWETALLGNDVSHWLGANLKSALQIYNPMTISYALNHASLSGNENTLFDFMKPQRRTLNLVGSVLNLFVEDSCFDFCTYFDTNYFICHRNAPFTNRNRYTEILKYNMYHNWKWFVVGVGGGGVVGWGCGWRLFMMTCILCENMFSRILLPLT